MQVISFLSTKKYITCSERRRIPNNQVQDKCLTYKTIYRPQFEFNNLSGILIMTRDFVFSLLTAEANISSLDDEQRSKDGQNLFHG